VITKVLLNFHKSLLTS